MDVTVESLEEMLAFGRSFGAQLRGGEVIELVGDVGTGKTTFVKGLADGLAVTDVVQSPTFTISRIYEARDGLRLCHYDFYRLSEAGIMRDELSETITDPEVVIALEWDETVQDLLPVERTIQIRIAYTGDTSRKLSITLPAAFDYLQKETV